MHSENYNKQDIIDAINIHPWTLYNINDSWLDDKDVVIAAIEKDGALLDLASERLKNDREVVFKAVKNCAKTIDNIGIDLSNDILFYIICCYINELTKNGLEHTLNIIVKNLDSKEKKILSICLKETIINIKSKKYLNVDLEIYKDASPYLKTLNQLITGYEFIDFEFSTLKTIEKSHSFTEKLKNNCNTDITIHCNK